AFICSDRTPFLFNSETVYSGLALARDDFSSTTGSRVDSKYAGTIYEHFGIGSNHADQLGCFVNQVSREARIIARQELDNDGAFAQFQSHFVVLIAEEFELGVSADAQKVSGLKQQLCIRVFAGANEIALFQLQAGFQWKLSVATLVNDVAFYGVGPDARDEAFDAFVLAQNQSTDYTDATNNRRNLWINDHEGWLCS